MKEIKAKYIGNLRYWINDEFFDAGQTGYVIDHIHNFYIFYPDNIPNSSHVLHKNDIEIIGEYPLKLKVKYIGPTTNEVGIEGINTPQYGETGFILDTCIKYESYMFYPEFDSHISYHVLSKYLEKVDQPKAEKTCTTKQTEYPKKAVYISKVIDPRQVNKFNNGQPGKITFDPSHPSRYIFTPQFMPENSCYVLPENIMIVEDILSNDKQRFLDELMAQIIIAGGRKFNTKELGEMKLIDLMNLIYPNNIILKAEVKGYPDLI